MASSSLVLRALAAGAAGLIVVALAAEGCGGRDQLGAPFEDGSGPGPGVGGNGGAGNFGGFGGSGNVGGFGGMSSSSEGPSTSVVVSSSVASSSSVGPSSSVSTVSTSVSSGPTSSSVSTVTTVGVGGSGPTSSSVSVSTSVSVGTGAGGGNPVDCLTCLANNCPSAIQCVTNPTCLQGVVCTVQSCLGNGPPNFACVITCFNGDFQAALLALQTIGCAFNQCGPQCQGLLGP